MANVMSMQQVKNNTSRSGFDLSRKNLFTAKIGEYLPVCVMECIPGDVHTIKTKWMSRTQPLNSAAYTRIKEYYDWYFVPTNLLWNKFNDFVDNMKENSLKADSIDSNTTLTDQHPYVTLSQIWTYINVIRTQGKTNFFGYDRAKLTCKLLEYLGYGDFTGALESSTFPSDRVDAVVNLFPLLAYQKIYQDHLRNSQWEKAYAPACNINYMRGTSNSLQIPLGDLDYDVENMFDLRYADWNKDYFMGVQPNSQYGAPASVIIDSNVSELVSTYISAGSVSGATGNLVIPTGSTAYSKKPIQVAGENANFSLSTTGMKNLAAALGQNFTILALRQAEAVQKMREVMQSHEQDYKSQLAARWNVSTSDAYSERCKWLGGDSANIDISEVINNNFQQTTTTVAASQADANIKGKAVGVGDGFVKCNTDVHGYLVCIYHAVPVLDFALNGIKKQNLKTLFTDYAQPELDKTGMVSVPLIEIMNSNVPTALKNGLLGYAPQYYEYKTAYDECHGAFNTSSTNSLTPWVAPIDKDYLSAYFQSIANSGYNSAITYYFFKVPPAVLDNIMSVNASSEISSDQLLINSYFDIKSVRKLDYNGFPY